ncbi:MAG: phosphate ABC transporter substrate-binding protein [Thermoplasmata archaeon]|nr:phosphate ABC transporter substrate-binding protein [Thermoplasmata archaeon]
MLKNKAGVAPVLMGVVAVLAIVVLVGAGFMMGWFGGEETETITVMGSTTVLPLAAAAAEDYMAEHPSATIQVSGGGSSVGVRGAGDGTADIGMASRELKSTEGTDYPGLIQHVIAKDGIAVIVNPSNAIAQLTIEQVKGIYNGTYTNWKQVGGADTNIIVVGRDSASGTRATFDDLVMDDEAVVATMQQAAANGEVHDTVMNNPAAIGYVGLGYVDDEVKGVEVSEDGITYVAPSVANVQNDAYPISRNLNMFTNGEPTGLAKEFLAYIKSPAGQQIVEEEGFVPIT